MRALLYTDNHFCQYSSIVRSRGSKYSTRLENQIKSINWAEHLAEETKCDAIIHLGDFFDRPDLNAEEITALKDIEWANLPHHFLVGNHELGMNDLSYNSVQALSMVPKATIIDTPTEYVGFGYRLILLPYILETNRKPLADYIKELVYKPDVFETQEYKHTIILSHNDISGIRYGQYESKVGFNVEEITKYCDIYVNGHLHNQQQVNQKILNLGNLTGQNFSEDALKFSHCVGILDTETLKIDLINNPYALKFFKFDVLNDLDLESLDKCDEYAIVSVKTSQSMLEKVKEKLAERKVLSYRLVTMPELTEKKTETTQLMKLDHIEQFKKFISDNIENSDVLTEELTLIK